MQKGISVAVCYVESGTQIILNWIFTSVIFIANARQLANMLTWRNYQKSL